MLVDGCALVLSKRGKLYWFWSSLIFVSRRHFTLCLGTFLMALTDSAECCQRLFGRLDKAGGANRVCREEEEKEEEEEEQRAELKGSGGGNLFISVQSGDNYLGLGINSVCLQTISLSFTCNITCVSLINTPRYIMVELAEWLKQNPGLVAHKKCQHVPFTNPIRDH